MSAMLDFNTAERQGAEPAPARRDDPASAFLRFLAECGLRPEGALAGGGVMQRCPTTDDKPGKKSGWYIFFDDDYPAGCCGNWKTDEKWDWSCKAESTLTAQERAAYRAKMEKARIAREREQAELADNAAAKAADIWAKPNACTAHPYLSAKGNASHGLRVSAGKLLVPVMDAAGTMRSLQFISAAGEKKFLFGGEKKGCFFRIPGNASGAGNASGGEGGESGTVAICEGYATAVSIHAATGWTVLAAFDAGNLLPVARAWKAAYPQGALVICGDDDRWNKINTGRVKAEACAREMGTVALFPQFKDVRTEPTDWNDLHAAEGLEAVKAQLVGAGTAPTPRRIESWGLESFQGEAPQRRWLVENIMPCGAVFVLAATGDAGKGMLTLDLGLKVAGKVPLPAEFNPLDFNGALTAFGNRVARQGPVVIISAEDDREELHRRLQGIGVGAAHNMYVMPLPNAGGPLPILVPGKHGPELTAEWLDLRAQLVALRPALIVIDPLASFVMADINADPAVGAYCMGHMATLAQDTDAAVVLVHHLAKTKANVATPEEARALVRGTTAIVDNARAVYVLWGVEEKVGRQTCKALDIPWARNRVMRGCLVKSNGPGDREVKTWVRNDVGLLEVSNEKIRAAAGRDVPLQLDSLLEAVAAAAERGQPFTRTGCNGLFARRQELPPELREAGRNKLEGYAQELLDKQKLVQCIAKGSTSKKWLDVPGGNFALGVGAFASGAQEELADGSR